MDAIGCTKRCVWGKIEEGILYCKDCGHTYDSKCPCNGVDFLYPENESEKRIKKALDIAWQYSQIDGAHHKAWSIDQMVRALCGSEEEYNKWVANYEAPESDDTDDYYKWDCGIAP